MVFHLNIRLPNYLICTEYLVLVTPTWKVLNVTSIWKLLFLFYFGVSYNFISFFFFHSSFISTLFLPHFSPTLQCIMTIRAKLSMTKTILSKDLRQSVVSEEN